MLQKCPYNLDIPVFLVCTCLSDRQPQCLTYNDQILHNKKRKTCTVAIIIVIISGKHHQDCVVLNADISIQRVVQF